MDKEAWRTSVHGVAKSLTRLSDRTEPPTHSMSAQQEKYCKCITWGSDAILAMLEGFPEEVTFFFLIKNILYLFWLCWVFVTAPRLSLVSASRGSTLVVVPVLLIVEASLVAEQGSGVREPQHLQHSGSRALAQQLWCACLAALWHAGSSWTRD